MASRKRHRANGYPHTVFNALERRGSYAWWRYYSEVEHSQQLQTLCDAYKDRIETLVPVCLALKDAILYRRNIDAFKLAWDLNEIIRRFEEGKRVG